MRLATQRLYEIVDNLDDTAAHQPTRLAGWSRGHVVSHLARNADGLVNLLIWARTGIEHPMYASTTDRDADVEEGSHRLVQVQREDLRAAGDRFQSAADKLTEVDWRAAVTNRQGREVPVSIVPWMRLVEVLVHLADLDLGVDFDQAITLAGDDAATILDYVVWTYSNRTDVPAVRLVVELPSGAERTWDVGDGNAQAVYGNVVSTLAWLTGREGVPAPRVADGMISHLAPRQSDDVSTTVKPNGRSTDGALDDAVARGGGSPDGTGEGTSLPTMPTWL